MVNPGTPRRPRTPPKPIPVVTGPPRPTRVVRTLPEVLFTAISAWPCENPTCGRVIIPGHAAIRSVEGGFFHAICTTTGWPPALIAGDRFADCRGDSTAAAS